MLLRGAMLIGITGLEPDNDDPVTFHYLTGDGEVIELVQEITGRMGAFVSVALPPFEIGLDDEGPAAETNGDGDQGEGEGEGTESDADAEERKRQLETSVPRAQRKKRRRATVARRSGQTRKTSV